MVNDFVIEITLSYKKEPQLKNIDMKIIHGCVNFILIAFFLYVATFTSKVEAVEVIVYF